MDDLYLRSCSGNFCRYQALTEPGDKVLVQTPVYNCFFSSIRNNGCEIIRTPLSYAHDTFTIDYEDLEKKAADPKVKVMLLCNPHNPAGRVWTREELSRIGKICIRNGLIVVSDEIHCELVFPGYTLHRSHLSQKNSYGIP